MGSRRRASRRHALQRWTPLHFTFILNNIYIFDMLNLKRFPGLIFTHKNYFMLFFILIICLFYVIHRWGFVCLNHEIKKEIDKLCELYRKGEVVGNLCHPLCIENKIIAVSCLSQHSKKQFVFIAEWNKRLIVLKSSYSVEQNLDKNVISVGDSPQSSSIQQSRKTMTRENISKIFARQSKKRNEQSKRTENEVGKSDSIEVHFENKIRKMVSERLNMTLTQGQLDDLKFLDVKNKFLHGEDSEERKAERENVFYLLQSQEYLLLRLFSDRELFPQIVGTCGHFYGVEYLERPKFDSIFRLDENSDWSERMRLAVAVMDFVEEVETNFPDALHLCDVQMNHLGITRTGRIKFLDLDFAFMKNVADKIIKNGKQCFNHADCDLLDCKSTCNPKTNMCDSGVVNDNLQVVCEKIFIGWKLSGKILVPGLLMSEHTPASLSALLRLCAENRRTPVNEDLRQRLYTTLTEMHQILLQKISAEGI